MVPVSYNAGVAFLQVVPSFVNVRRQLERDARQMAQAFHRAFEDALPESFRDGLRQAQEHVDRESERMGDTVREHVGDGVRDGVRDGTRDADRDADDSGERVGRRFAGAFDRAVRTRTNAALGALGENVNLDEPHRQLDRQLNFVRDSIREINRMDFGPNFDEDEFRSWSNLVNGELRRLEEHADSGSQDFFNIRDARRQFDALDEVVRDARRRGEEAGGRFSGAFGRTARRRIDAAFDSLPELPLRFSPTEAEDGLNRIRTRISELRDLRIGVDIDDAGFVRRMRAIREDLDDFLRGDNLTVRLRGDAEAARNSFRDFFDRDFPDLAERSSNRVGGVFERTFRQRVTSALSALPEATIELNTDDAQRQLGFLRAQLTALRDETVNVDVDSAEAITQLRILQTQFATLALTSPNIQVRTDSAQAARELGQILALTRIVDDADVVVNVDVDSAAARMRKFGQSIDPPIHRLGVLISLGLTLGTSLVPAVAGLVPVLAATATAAAGAALGVGVLALALSGVFGAVKALDKYQDDAKKSAKSLSGAQNAVANSLTGVRSAERSLATTRENVAEQTRTAARNVVSAQKAVQDAVRDRQRAEQDLVDAIKEANRADEDRRLSIRGNALSQRQANLDIAEAKRELDKVLANPRASEAEREQAKITYEQKALQLDELTVAGRRLAEEQAKFNKEGAAGTEGVKNAQERLRTATEKVADSQDKLAEAIRDQQKAQVQGARQIEAATEAVAQAQRGLEQATVSAGVAGGEALDNLRESMAQLSPAGQKFAQFLFGLKDEFLTLRAAAERGLLPGLQAGITLLIQDVPRLASFIEKLGTGIGNIFFEVVKGFKHPEWQRFFAFLGETSFPAVNGIVSFLFTFARGIASLIETLSVFNAGIGEGLLRFAGRFADWAAQLRHSNGFQEFVEYVSRTGPKVLELLGGMLRFIERFLIAAAPVGEFVVDVFGAIFRVLNAIPLPILQGLVILMSLFALRIIALKAAVIGINVVIAPLYTFFERASAAITRMGTAAVNTGRSLATMSTLMTTAGGRATVMATAIGGAGAAASTAGVAMGRFMSFLGGPWGIAIGLAITAFTLFSDSEEDLKTQSDQLKPGLENLAAAFRQTGTDASETVQQIVSQDKALQALLIRTKEFGLATEDVVKAVEGDAEASRKLLGEYDARLSRLKQLAYEYDQAAALDADRVELEEILRQAGVANREELERLIGTQQSERKAVAESSAEKAKAAEASRIAADAARALRDEQLLLDVGTQHLTAAQQEARTAYLEASAKAHALADLIKVMGDNSSTAADRANALKTAIDAYTSTQIAAIEADERAIEAQLRIASSAKEAGYEYDLTKAKSDEHTEAILRSRNALEDALQATRAKTLADIEAGVPVEEAIRRGEERIQQILNEIPETARNSAEVQKLADAYGRVPKDVQTAVKIQGAEDVYKQLKELKIAQIALDRNISVHDARIVADDPNNRALFRAQGGYIWGPGTETSDSIPAMLSRGEYVTRARAVRYYGADFLKAVNDMSFPREHLSYFANGGLVQPETWIFPIDAKKSVRVPSREEVLGKVAVVDTGGWPSSPAAQRGDSGVWRKVVALINSTGPISGSFGNSYRPGDPLWHGSGRAVDWMGFNQDALATFLAGKRPLELIHRTAQRDYAYTRGVDKGSFRNQLMEEHRNHIHIAFDQGGWLQPGYTNVYNGLGAPEAVLTPTQSKALVAMASNGTTANGPRVVNNFEFADSRLDASRLRAINDAEMAYARTGRAR